MGRRDSKILEVLSAEGSIEVTTLAERFDVSTVTMRKDLDSLEERGLIVRQHGLACLGNPDDINGRLAIHYDEKLAIARAASRLIYDGETIMIESGSCCCLLAAQAARDHAGLTIITNSAFIAQYLKNEQVDVILLGGLYQSDAQVMVGPLLAESVKNFRVDKFFIGADGYDDRGFSNCDILRASAVRSMAERADQLIVLTESEKFHHSSVCELGLSGRVNYVITDKNIPDSARNLLEKQGTQILIAEDRR